MVELKSLKEWDAKVGDIFVYHAGAQSSPTGTKRKISKVSGSDYYSKDVYRSSLEDRLTETPWWSLVSRAGEAVVEETADKKPDGGPSTYYDFPFQDWTTVNDMVEYLSEKSWGKHSWIFKDILKAVTRWGNKKGTEHSYDAKKIIYYGCRLLMSVTDKKTLQDYLQQLLDDKQFQ